MEYIHQSFVTCYALINNHLKRNDKTSIVPTKWSPHSFNCSTCSLRIRKAKGGRPPKKVRTAGGRPKQMSIISVDDVLNLDSSKPLPDYAEKLFSNLMSIKLKQSNLPNNTVLVETSGSQPFHVTPIALARKDSGDVTNRTLNLRTKQSKDILQLISGNSEKAITAQSTHIQ